MQHLDPDLLQRRLDELGRLCEYDEALYRTTLATVGGEPLFPDAGGARVVEIGLIMYSLIVFATLAGSAGAFILERRDDDRARAAAGDRSEAAQRLLPRSAEPL